ncbi:MAG: hypothetical protein RLZZ210_623 [Pseudomonadota bacterium]|jgi:hypothetical protein
MDFEYFMHKVLTFLESVILFTFKVLKKFIIEFAKLIAESIKKTYLLLTGKLAFFLYGCLLTAFVISLLEDEQKKALVQNMQNQGIDNLTIHRIFTEGRFKNAN